MQSASLHPLANNPSLLTYLEIKCKVRRIEIKVIEEELLQIQEKKPTTIMNWWE